MNERYLLTIKPEKAREVFLDVLIALSPVMAWSVFFYGLRPITLMLICAVCVSVIDVIFSLIFKRGTITDLSCAVTGVIAALLLPASSPLWLPAFVGALAGVVRNVFGGLGKNPINPAATSILVTHFAFPKVFESIPTIYSRLSATVFDVGSYNAASESALETVIRGSIPDKGLAAEFFGMRAGMMGEMSAFLILAGGIYLVCRRIIKPTLPIIFIAAVGRCAYFKPTLIAASDSVAISGAIYNILGSSTMLCAVFMITDPVTSPKTTKGMLVSGVVGGIVTIFVRYRYSIEISAIAGVLASNVVTLIVDRLIHPMPFGGFVKKKAAAK